MLRVLLSLALIALASTSAFAKPKVAILGLEVTGAVDAAATTVARDLTEGMRTRAKGGNGPFTLAPNSDRELIDEKVIKQCENEEPSCMSEIGKDMDADVLVYGKLEKDGGGFQATIVMLDVKKRTTIKTTFVTVPPGASSDTVRGIAKKTYLELAPAASGSAKLVVTANVDTGSVFVDDELRETLSGGRATLTLPEGRYRIAVESDGYKRKELTVKLTEDDSATESFELSKAGGGGGGGISPWKPIFGVTAAAAIGLGVFSAVKWFGTRDSSLSDEERSAIEAATGMDKTIDYDDCTPEVFSAIDNASAMVADKKFQSRCESYDLHVRFAIIASGVGAVALVAGYFAFVHGGGKKEPRSRVAITPTLSPGGGGATLRFEW